MAARQYYYQSATAEATTTATTDTTIATLNFTPDDNSDYVILWSALAKDQSTSADHIVSLTRGTTATLNSTNWEAKDVTSYRAVGGMAVATFATATGSHNFLVRHKLESGVATGGNLKDTHLIAIKLATADAWFFSTATTSSSTATTKQNAATLSFTPSATGEYLIIGSAMRNLTVSLTIAGDTLLSVGGTGTDYSVTPRWVVNDTTSWEQWFGAVRLDLTATERTLAIMHTAGTSTGALSHMRDRCLVALRLDGGFENDFYDESRATTVVTGTSTDAGSYSASLVFAPVATGMHLVIFSGMTRSPSTVIDTNARIVGTNIDTISANEECIGASDVHLFQGIRRWDATSTATRTWQIGHGIESTSTGGVFRKSEGYIILLQLDAAATATGGGASTFNVSASANAKWTVVTVREGQLVKAATVRYAASITRDMATSAAATVRLSAVAERQGQLSHSAIYKWSAAAIAGLIRDVTVSAAVKFSAAVVREGQLLIAPLADWTGSQTGQIGKLLSGAVKFSATAAREATLNFSALYRFSAAADVVRAFLLSLAATFRVAATTVRQGALSLATSFLVRATTSTAATFVRAFDATYRFSAIAVRSAALSFAATYKWTGAAEVLKVFQVAATATFRLSATVARETALSMAALYRWGASATATFIAGAVVTYQVVLTATYKFTATSDEFFRAFVKAFFGEAGLGMLFKRKKRRGLRRGR